MEPESASEPIPMEDQMEPSQASESPGEKADVEQAEQPSRQNSNKSDASTFSRKDYITLGIALLGVILGGLSLIQSEVQRRRYVRIEANQLLFDAKDILEGRDPTFEVGEEDGGFRRLELVWRNLDKAWTLDRRNPRLFHLQALYYQESNQVHKSYKSLRRAIELDSRMVRHSVDLASRMERAGQLAEAEEVLRGTFKLAPDASRGSALARFLQRQNRFEEARDVYIETIRQAPQSHVFNSFSWFLEENWGIDRAESILRDVVSESTKNVKGLVALASLQEKQTRFLEAGESFEKAVSLAPYDSDIRVESGKFLRRRADFEAAKKQLLQAISLDPTNFEAHYTLAELSNHHLEFGKAEKHYRLAAGGRGNAAELRLASLLLRQGRIDEADRIYQSCLRKEPQHHWNYSSYSQFLKSLGRLKDAERVLKESVENSTRPEQAFADLSGFYRDQNRLEEAETAIQEALSLATFSEASVYERQLVEIQEMQHKDGRLEKFLDENSEEQTGTGWDLLTRARLARKDGKLEEALSAYREALKEADEETACYAYVEAHELSYTVGRIVNSTGLAQHLLYNYPSDSYCQVTAARFLDKTGELVEAQVLLRKALDIRPGDWNSWFRLAAVLEKQGREDEAEDALREAIRVNPSYLNAYTRLGQLLRDSGRAEEAQTVVQRAKEVEVLVGRR